MSHRLYPYISLIYTLKIYEGFVCVTVNLKNTDLCNIAGMKFLIVLHQSVPQTVFFSFLPA